MFEELINKNKNINRGYRKLDIWKEAINLFVYVKKIIDTTPNISFKVKAQIEDSAFSVHSNIAEGYARRHLKESIQFNNVALSSLAENYSQFFAMLSANVIEKEWFDKYDELHFSLENKLICYNKAQIKLLNDKSDWHDDYIVREYLEKYGNKTDM